LNEWFIPELGALITNGAPKPVDIPESSNTGIASDR